MISTGKCGVSFLAAILMAFLSTAAMGAPAPLNHEEQAREYTERGLDSVRRGRLDEAVTNFTKAIELTPYDADSYDNLAHAYLRNGNVSGAIPVLTEAIRIRPSDGAAYDLRGTAYSEQGHLEEAIADFNAALRIKPGSPRVLNNRGVAYLKKGDYERAIADLTEATHSVPGNAKVLVNRGKALVQAGRWGQAVRDFTKAIKLESGQAEAYNDLAWILATCPTPSLRDGKEAVRLATTACDLGKWEKWYCIGTLAAAEAEVGDFDRAVALQERVLAAHGASEKDRAEEKERLDLYREHRPFRSKAR